MSKLKLVIVAFIFIQMAFTVQAAGEEVVWYRCSSQSFGKDDVNVANAPWTKVKPIGDDKLNYNNCTTNIEADKGYIYLQYGKGTDSPPARKTGIYTVTITFQAAAGAATATPTPTPTKAAGSTTAPTPTPTLTPTPTDTQGSAGSAKPSSAKECANGLKLSAEEAKFDVSKNDCKINTFDVAETYTHFSK